MFRRAFCAAVAAACLIPAVAQAQQPRLQLDYQSQPRLGFQGHMEFGWGLKIDSVRFGSSAARLGLERGDVIIQVNDVRIRSMNDYYWALRNSGGHVRLLVDDVHGRGRLWTRGVYLNNGAGPIMDGGGNP